MTRDKLAEREGLTLSYSATFDRYGRVRNFTNYRHLIVTMLLRDVYDRRGEYICDHIWVVAPKGHEKLGLAGGDIVGFRANVAPYRKGYVSSDNYPQPRETDYRFAGLRRLEVLRRGGSGDGRGNH